MLEENNDIIIVDDSLEDVHRISNVFLDYGIGCRTFVYDYFDTIETPLKNVKIAFFDICLSTTGNDTEQFTVLCDALKTYVSCDNKAFVLVFWTSKPSLIEDFKTYVKNREGETVPKPIAIKTIDKHSFIENQGDLKKTLSDLMSDPIVSCLFSFETELKNAANKSLHDILKYILFPDIWGDNKQYIDNIKTVFTKIAIETFGNNRGSENPDLAIKEAFGPLFLHYLCENESKVWQCFLGDIDKNNIKAFPDSTIVAKLNTLFHLDLSVKEDNARGSVRRIERTNNTIIELFEKQIGINPNEWISNVLLKNTKIDVDNTLELIALEYSAACDYSNAKNRTHCYMLGIIIPDEIFHQSKKIKFSDAIYEVPFKFIYSERECVMILHLNYTVNEEDSNPQKILGKRIFSLKSEVMNMISNRHSFHISRIGITSFR